MKGKLSTILIIMVFFAGLSLLLYPTVSNFWNSLHQGQVIVDYTTEIDALQQEEYDCLLAEARAYNEALPDRTNPYALPETLASQYNNMLSVSERGIMAYLEIPSIDCTLPVGHGTEDDVLSNSVGHLEWSSLPVGGESTHCVLSGHRGLPSSELLTNIDHLEGGDVFYLHVLGETLQYRVDQISVVEPEDLSLLGIVEGKDYVTLVTCTPYGINSHRLLVRGVRVLEQDEQVSEIYVTNECSLIGTRYPVVIALAGLSSAAFVLLLLSGKQKKRGKREKNIGGGTN